jgi:hypothetical protein
MGISAKDQNPAKSHVKKRLRLFCDSEENT